jgi:hypothetical protein
VRGQHIAVVFLAGACASAPVPEQEGGPSPYLLVFAGDRDEAEDDFFAVFDLLPGSPTIGRVVTTVPIGSQASMPHHMEYELPAPGELLFANAHHHELTLLVNVADPLRPVIERTFSPPAPLRFGHDFARLPDGNVIAGFLRSDGPSPKPGEATGRLQFDPSIRSRDGRAGYIDLEAQAWPHGPSRAAWGHAALFLGDVR